MPQGLNLIGQKFGRLTVVGMVHGPSGRLWQCLCDCGTMKEKPLTTYELKNGKRNHCGCLERVNGMRAHGQYKSKLYKVWSAMKRRCSRPNDPSYHNYGGRGITICAEWLEFPPFYAWAMENGYREGLTIERKDNDQGYSPDNCAWIPKPEQSSNTRRCKMITYQGETHNIKVWAQKFGISYARLQHRLKRGWSIERAFTTGIPCRAAQDQ